MEEESYNDRISIKEICNNIYKKLKKKKDWEPEARELVKEWFSGERKINIIMSLLRGKNYFMKKQKKEKMKTVYYMVQYSDGIKQFLSQHIPENLPDYSLKEQIFESQGIRDIVVYDTLEQWEQAKKNN